MRREHARGNRSGSTARDCCSRGRRDEGGEVRISRRPSLRVIEACRGPQEHHTHPLLPLLTPGRRLPDRGRVPRRGAHPGERRERLRKDEPPPPHPGVLRHGSGARRNEKLRQKELHLLLPPDGPELHHLRVRYGSRQARPRGPHEERAEHRELPLHLLLIRPGSGRLH